MKYDTIFKSKSLWGKFAVYTFIMLLPFVVFYWQVPFLSGKTMGNDYIGCTIREQMELQYALEHGFFPLYVPGFHGGQSSAALTLGQLYHPSSHLAASLPGYWAGHSLQWNTLLRLLSMGLLHVGLFVLLCRLRLNPVLAFIISFITIYNLRMLDMLRAGAFENFSGFLFLCMMMAFFYIKPTRFVGPVAMIAATYLLICGGHPQMMYFGLIGAGITAIFLPFVLNKISPEIKVNKPCLIKYFTTTGACLLTGILLSFAYIIPFYFDFLRGSAQRAGQGYHWSLQFSDTAGGILNNFFAPLHSDVNGAFGSSALIILIVLIPILYLARIKVPLTILLLWFTLAVIFLYSLGKAAPVHYLFWKYFPFAQNFRVPGRIAVLFPFLFLLMLAWLFRSPEKIIRSSTKSKNISPSRILALVVIPLFFLYNWVLVQYLPKPGHYTPKNINSYPQWVDSLIFWLGLLSLIMVVLYSFYNKGFIKKWRTVIGILLAVTVLLQVTVEIRYGTWVQKAHPQPTLEKMDHFKKKKLTYSGPEGYGMESIDVIRQMHHSILEPALAKFYREYQVVANQGKAYSFLKKNNVTHTIVVEGAAGLRNPGKDQVPGPGNHDSIRLEESSFNRVLFSVNAGAPGFLAFSSPYPSRWRALIDGNKTPVYRANGYMPAVYLEAGQHQVEFRYWSSAAFAGMLISCLTFLLLGLYFAFFVFRKNPKLLILLLAVSVLVPLGLLATWYNSLYKGDNLGTRYTWSAKEFPPQNNLAYAKKTSMNRQRLRFYAGLGVDGEMGKPFKTAGKRNGWWQVDLGSPQKIGEIVIHDRSFLGRKHLPLKILGSIDGKTFKLLKSIDNRGQEHPWRIPMKGELTRFVRLKSSKKGTLSFNEIEIYPPSSCEQF